MSTPQTIWHSDLAQSTTGDDHTQYTLLAGRSGGQSLNGGTGSGEDLTLISTSHATKGSIFLGASSAYDEEGKKLGIGTTSPVLPVHIQKDTETAGDDVGILSDIYNDSDNAVAFFAVRRRLGAIGAQTAITNNKTLGVIYFQGSYGTNETTNIANGANIIVNATANWSGSGTPGAMIFNTTPSTSFTPVEAMRINSDQFVSIGGVTTPSSPLHVAKTIVNNSASHAMMTVAGAMTGNCGGASGEMFSLHMGSYFQPSASISIAAGFRTDITADPTTGVTIASYFGGRYVIYTGNEAGSVTNMFGMEMVPVFGTIKPGATYGLQISNFGASGISGSTGVNIVLPTGSTSNFYMGFDTADATDPTGGGGAATGRLPIIVGGVARYLAYY